VTVGISPAADLDRRREVHHEESLPADPLGRLPPHVLVGRHEGRQADDSGAVEEMGHLDRAAEILAPLPG
jgi:hypothetical protein